MPHPRKSVKAKKNPVYHGDNLLKRWSKQERKRRNKSEKWEKRKKK